MIVNFFDGNTDPGQAEHGELGFDHCGKVEVDYEYQAEQWVIEVRDIDQSVVRVELHDDDQVLRRWIWTDTHWQEQDPDVRPS